MTHPDQLPDELLWSERWRLASLCRSDFYRIALISVMVGLGYILFHLQGNTSDITHFGRSVVAWMVFRWNDSSISFGSADYSHGFLIPLVSVYVLWHQRKELQEVEKKASWVGLVCIIGALLLHWVGAKAQHPRLSLFAIIGLLWSIPYYLYGCQVAKILLFPCSFLVFCVPLGFLDELTFPLRMVATTCATALLNGLGIAAEQSGSAIYSMAGGGFEFDVADPCSGLRSLMAMTALTAVYAYLTQPTLLKKWVLFACSVPLAIVGNIARITTVGLVAEAFGQKLATGIYHDYSGYIVFSFAIILMVAVGSLINVNPKEVVERWKLALSGHTSLSSV